MDEYDGDIYIERRQSNKPGAEYIIPSCVTSASLGVLPVYNTSEEPMHFNVDQLVARGASCSPDVSRETEVRINMLHKRDFPKFTLEDIQKQVNPNIGEYNINILLSTLNSYRDCFAQNINELGCIKGVEIEIQLKDDKPVTYKPYRLSIQERQCVREIVDDLLDNGIIQESHSPYASPIVLVKRKAGTLHSNVC